MCSFEGEDMQTQCGVLGHMTDLYFYDHRYAIKIDENGHCRRNIDYEIERLKAIEQELGCKFI